MARYFLDTSALVKYYHAEAGTPIVSALFAEPGGTVLISSLGLLEMQSAIAMKVRSGALAQEAAGLLRGRLMLDIAAGAIEVYSVAEEHFIGAERLLGRHAFARRLRTLDALQLAVALDLHTQELVDTFVTADQALAEAASREGLGVIDPTH